MRRFKTGMILSSFLLLLSIIPVYAETNRVDDDGQMSFFSPQIVYNVSGDQISATFQVNYRNDSYEDRVSFALLIPVPAEPESVETVDPLGDQYGADGWIDHDQGLGGAPLYSIHVTPPSTVYCNYLFGDTYNYNLGSGSAPLDYPEFSRYSVLAGDEVDQWLSNNEYTLDERQTALLPEYIAQGYSMVALGFDALQPFGRTQPVTITYTAPELSIPLRWLDFTGSYSVWVYGDTRYTSSNYADVQIDFSQLRDVNRVMKPYYPRDEAYYGLNNYGDLLTEGLAAHQGEALVTEYAGKSQATGQYLTRLYGEIPEESVTVDPGLVPAPDLPEISDQIVVEDYSDTLDYYGCTTASLVDDALIANAPAGRSRILGLSIAHPEEWMLSQFDFLLPGVDGKIVNTLYVLSPQAVTEADFNASKQGETPPPMLILYSNNAYYGGFWDFDSVLQDYADSNNLQVKDFVRFIPDGNYQGVEIALLTTDEDYAANAALYDAMLHYDERLPYYTSDDLLYTVFLDGVYPVENQDLNARYPDSLSYSLGTGYLEGWSARVADNATREVMITPDDAPNGSGAAVHIWYGGTLIDDPEADFMYDEANRAKLVQALNDKYGVTGLDALADKTTCGYISDPISFTAQGRTGLLYMVISYRGQVVELSAPSEVYDQYQTTFEEIGSNLRIVTTCG